ncbi:MAG TPA: Ig-like domain-containing protein [Nitrospiraceae bacterium]|nr:Ig-like domain-containing protein [Nitrospiraceae bacterium]
MGGKVRLLLIVMGCAGFILGDLNAEEKLAGTLTVRDVLTMPGRPVMIEATLRQDSLLKPMGLGGELVEFRVGGKTVGTAMTGGDGRARLEYTPHMRGNQTITVRLADSKRAQAAGGTATLFAWERRRPIVLIEFAALTEPTQNAWPGIPGLTGQTGVLHSPTPLPEAANELKRLTDFFFNVAYVSRAGPPGPVAMDELRDWLTQKGFPPGILLSIKPEKAALTTLIDDLRGQGWDNVKAGVGRTKEFAEVLIDHRIGAIIVPEPDRGDLPRKAQVAKGWKDVRKKLQG